MATINVDVLFMADHFVLVTSIITEYSPDSREVEQQAWKRLADEYGDDWVESTKSFIKKVSIEVVQDKHVPEPTVNDVVKSIEESDV